MTTPFPALPSVSLGNTPLDLSRAAASFISGQREERAQRREEAMKNALMQLQAMRIRPQRPFSTVSVVDGKLVHALMDPETGETTIASGPGVEAPTSQLPINTLDEFGRPAMGVYPRYVPPASGGEVTAINPPLGQSIRPPPPRVVTAEGAQGPEIFQLPAYPPTGGGTAQHAAPAAPGQAPTQTPGQAAPGSIYQHQYPPGAHGTGLTPRAQEGEVTRAQFAANMARAAHGMEQQLAVNPQVVDEVIGRINSEAIARSLPVVGAPAGEVIRSAMAIGLSPAAAKWLAEFNTFVGFAVPELAGKQMTITEMRQQMAMFAPAIGEPEESKALKRQNIRFRVQSSIAASGAGWTRIMNDPNIGPQIPAEYGGTMQDVNPQQSQPRRSKYGYVRP